MMRPVVVARFVAAVVVLAVALGLGISHTVDQGRDARDGAQEAVHRPRIGDRLVLVRPDQERFIEFVRATVPEHARVRIVRPVSVQGHRQAQYCTPGVSGPAYWWFVYSIAPRASVCGAHPDWIVYWGVTAPSEGRVFRFAADLAVVRA